MCGLFLSTQGLGRATRRNVGFLVGRRGTLPTRWQEFASNGVMAHSLLPLRGPQPRIQPLAGRRGTLLFTGDLGTPSRQSADTDQVLEKLETRGPRRAFAEFDGNWAVVYRTHQG